MGNSFDVLAKQLGGAPTRREALRRLGRLAGGALLTLPAVGGGALLAFLGLGGPTSAATLCQMSCARICQSNRRCGCADCVNRCARGCPATAKMCYAGGQTCTCCSNQGGGPAGLLLTAGGAPTPYTGGITGGATTAGGLTGGVTGGL